MSDVTAQDALLHRLSVNHVEQYLTAHGWKRESDPRRNLTVFSGHKDGDGKPLEIILPTDEKSVHFRSHLANLVNLVAFLEDTPSPNLIVRMLDETEQNERCPARIHPTAIVSPNAELGENVEVGPFTIINDHVTIGANTRIDAHVKIDAYTKIGESCQIFFGAVLGHVSVDLKHEGGECWTHIGDRNILREYVCISSSSFDGQATVIGDDNLLMHWSNVAHDCVLGNHVIMANFATLGGHVEVESNVRIGAQAAFHQFVRVGTGSMAGACSKFVQDVPPYMVVDGNPARVRGLNLLGRGTAQSHPMRDVPDESISLLKKAYHLLFKSDLNVQQAVERVRAEIPADPHVQHLIEFIENTKRGITQ